MNLRNNNNTVDIFTFKMNICSKNKLNPFLKKKKYNGSFFKKSWHQREPLVLIALKKGCNSDISKYPILVLPDYPYNMSFVNYSSSQSQKWMVSFYRTEKHASYSTVSWIIGENMNFICESESEYCFEGEV